MTLSTIEHPREISFADPAAVKEILHEKSGPILKSDGKHHRFQKREIVLVENLFPGEGSPVRTGLSEIFQTPQGFRRLNPELIKEGAVLFATDLGCDLNQEVTPQCSYRADPKHSAHHYETNSRHYLVERRDYPTNTPGVTLVRESWFDSRRVPGKNLHKESLLIVRS